MTTPSIPEAVRDADAFPNTCASCGCPIDYKFLLCDVCTMPAQDEVTTEGDDADPAV